MAEIPDLHEMDKVRETKERQIFDEITSLIDGKLALSGRLLDELARFHGDDPDDSKRRLAFEYPPLNRVGEIDVEDNEPHIYISIPQHQSFGVQPKMFFGISIPDEEGERVITARFEHDGERSRTVLNNYDGEPLEEDDFDEIYRILIEEHN